MILLRFKPYLKCTAIQICILIIRLKYLETMKLFNENCKQFYDQPLSKEKHSFDSDLQFNLIDGSSVKFKFFFSSLRFGLTGDIHTMSSIWFHSFCTVIVHSSWNANAKWKIPIKKDMTVLHELHPVAQCT